MSGMTIGQFEEICNKHPGLKVNFAPYDCGSWRGVYAEACIFVEMNGECYLEEFLPFIDLLKTETHWGYKGGQYVYDKHTPLNFETENRSWSDGETFERMLSENPVFAGVVQ